MPNYSTMHCKQNVSATKLEHFICKITVRILGSANIQSHWLFSLLRFVLIQQYWCQSVSQSVDYKAPIGLRFHSGMRKWEGLPGGKTSITSNGKLY